MTGRRTAVEEFSGLVRLYDERLRALAFRMIGDAHGMDDALQDAYARAFRSYDEFRRESDPGTWLYRIVHNSCVDVLRRERRHRHQDLDSVEVEGEAEGEISTPSGDGRLPDALARLSPEHRAVVLLIDGDGFDYGEAADILGVPVGTVASRLSRAHALLRNYLKEVAE
jgi:RNA polymerase sigma-70 factor (ECF subfamily)